MPGPIDKALSPQTMQYAGEYRNTDGARPGPGIAGADMSDVLRDLGTGQLGAEQLMQLLLLLSQGGMGAGPEGPAPMGPQGAPAGPTGPSPIDQALF
jgi:hypothetical protein